MSVEFIIDPDAPHDSILRALDLIAEDALARHGLLPWTVTPKHPNTRPPQQDQIIYDDPPRAGVSPCVAYKPLTPPPSAFSSSLLRPPTAVTPLSVELALNRRTP